MLSKSTSREIRELGVLAFADLLPAFPDLFGCCSACRSYLLDGDRRYEAAKRSSVFRGSPGRNGACDTTARAVSSTNRIYRTLETEGRYMGTAHACLWVKFGLTHQESVLASCAEDGPPGLPNQYRYCCV